MNYLKFLLATLFLNVSFATNGQNTIVLSDENINFTIKSSNLYHIIDSSKSLTFQEILTKEKEGYFSQVSYEGGEIKTPEVAYWFSFSIDQSQLNQSIIIEMPVWKTSNLDFFIEFANGEYKEVNTGAYRPFKQKSIAYKNYAVELPRSSEIVKCYARVTSDIKSPFLFMVKSNKGFIAYNQNEYLLLGLFYGILIMMGIYNLLLFFVVKERGYLYYFLYVISCIFVCTAEDGLGFQYLWPEFSNFNLRIDRLAPHFFMIFFVIYSSSFLELNKRQPRFFRVIVGTALFSCFYGLWHINSFPNNSIHHIFIVPFFLIYFAGWKEIKNRFAPARLFTVAFSFTIFSIIIMILRGNGFFDWSMMNNTQTFLIVYSLNFTLVFEIAILSFAQAIKIQNNQQLQQYTLLKSEQTFRHIFNGSFDALLVIDAKTKNIVDVNQQAIQLFNYPKSQLENLNIDKIIELTTESDSSPHQLSKILLRYETNDKETIFKATGIKSTGELVLCELTISLLKKLGNQNLVVVALKDITQQRLAEKNLDNKTKEIVQKNKELQDYVNSNSELESFAYTASHDMIQPIRSIKSFSQLLKRHLTNEEKLDKISKEFLGFIISGASNLDQLIHDLLEHSKFSSSKEISFIPTNFEDIFLKVKLNLNQQITENEVQLVHDTMPTLPVESTRISQLFQNLISNSIKFRKKDKTCRILISVKESDDCFTFTLKDNGIGIPKEHQKQIFNIFTKLHSPQDYNGSGIGLATCKKIVEQHGGDIWVSSKVGEGTTFFFTLKKNMDHTKQFQLKSKMYN